MVINVAEDYKDLSAKTAQKVAEYITANPDALICFAAGNTPLGVFSELVSMQDRGEIDLSACYYIGLDEWVGLGINDAGSCACVMHEALYNYIPKERVLMFDGLAEDVNGECRRVEDWINEHGGIGFALLGIGMNGHIGFNEPGTPDAEGCFAVVLDDVTKSVSKKYFGRERDVEFGITIGWRTLFNADEVVLMASGSEKAQIVKKSLQGEITPTVPASLMQKHSNLTFMLDKDAAGLVSNV